METITIEIANKKKAAQFVAFIKGLKYVKSVPKDEDIRIELLPLEDPSNLDRVRTLDPGQIVFLGEFVLKVAEGVYETCPQRGEVRNRHISVFAGGAEDLQRRVFGGLIL